MDKQKLMHQLFIGKVSEIIGQEKTVELLREAKTAIDATELQLPQARVISSVCGGCEESTGKTQLWCCNNCGKRTEDF